MYQFVLSLHNAWRWVVVLAILFALVRFISGWRQHKRWTRLDRIGQSLYTHILDVQLVLGVTLYFFLSPLTRTAMADVGSAMWDSNQRFFLIEHGFGMLIAITIAHVFSVVARRATPDTRKFKLAALGVTLVLIAVLISMPWRRSLIPLF